MSSGTQLPILVKPPYPMMARVGKLEDVAHAVADGYVIEPKLDGIRCMVKIDEVGGARTVRLFNRQLVDITGRFPEVVADIRLKVRETDHTLDGEIYVLGDEGQPDFQRVQTRANRLRYVADMAAVMPAKFTAFDILRAGGMDITRWTQEDRRRTLNHVAAQLVIATYSQSEADDLAARQIGEGLMLKHVSGKYYPGSRDAGWLKIKWLREVECVVGGVTFGIGKRESTFGGLLVGVPRPADREGTARLTYIGTVGTGFTNVRLEGLNTHLRTLRTDECPFTAHGADWDLAYFVRPVMRVKVAFAEYTRGGIMRFPRFVGVSGLLAEKLP